MAHGTLQLDVSGIGRHSVHRIRQASGRTVHERPSGDRIGRRLLAFHQLLLSVVRIRNGDRSVIQRRGRYTYADTRESVLLLALGNPAGLLTVARRWNGAARRLPRDRNRRVDDSLRRS